MAKKEAKATAQQDGAERVQYAALCWRMHRKKIEVLMITSRDTGRWVIPKGWPMSDRSPCQSAATEAWEEAGVTGEVSAEDLGLFNYDKFLRPQHAVRCAVRVFPLRVATLAMKFPERHQRRRKWFAVEKAAKKVAEPELRQLLQSLSAEVLNAAPVEALAKD